jgi:HYR domain
MLVIAAAVAALTASTAASADTVNDNVDSSGIVTASPGSSVAVSWRIHETANDGCSPATGQPSILSVTPSGPITASSASLTFTSCESLQSITFTVAAGAAPGDYSVAVSVSDGDGDSFGGVRNLTIRVTASAPPPSDTTPPVVTAPADQVLEATSSSGATQSFTGTAVDNVDGSLTAPCEPTTFPFGETTATCKATDAAGNSGTATFKVRVQDTTGPALSLPGPITAPATSSAGATVSYNASATDIVDGSVSVSCSPPSGSIFALGETMVNCSASDSRGNGSAGAFKVTVTNSGPAITVPGTQVVEAIDASGARVNFVPPPTATDREGGPLVPSCSPASGSSFPLGASTVTCTAIDSDGMSSTASFQVVVRDTTPPVVTPPLDTVIFTDVPLASSDPRVTQFLGGASAADLVGVVRLDSNAPPVLPLGSSSVTFTAVDAAGNSAAASARIELRPSPVTPQPPVPPPVVRLPPANVLELRARSLDRGVALEWEAAPRATRYVITRSDRANAPKSVYDGRATSFVDRGLVNGDEYRYVVISYDADGLRSVGVAIVAVPSRPILVSPKHNARVLRPPPLKWRRVARATYYNVQLFRVGADGARTKVLTTWPVKPQLPLRWTWRYSGKRQRLTTGVYEWYLWAGFGARPAKNYSPLLGWSRFNLGRTTH